MYLKMENKNKELLTIVTIVLNDREGFIKTFESLRAQKFRSFEYVVVDGGSTDGTKKFIEDNQRYIDQYVSERDGGIYDAYNKGIRLASGKFIWFLNAGDYLVGNVLNEELLKEPCRIRVKFINQFGYLQNYKLRNFKFSHPYNTQGIIYFNKGIYFNTEYKIAADYQFYIDNGYTYLPFVQTEGYVMYDNNGISTKMTKLKYEECFKIIQVNFGWTYAFQFFVRSFIKYSLKKLLRLSYK